MLKHYELERISVSREHWGALADQGHHTQANLIVPATSKLEAAAVLAELGYPHVGVSALRLAGGTQYAALAEAGILQAGRIYVVPLSRADGVGEITSRQECKRIGLLKMQPGSDFSYRFAPEGPSMREELLAFAERLDVEATALGISAAVRPKAAALRGVTVELHAIIARHPESGK